MFRNFVLVDGSSECHNCRYENTGKLSLVRIQKILFYYKLNNEQFYHVN